MAKYILKRLLYMIPMMFIISLLVFVTIQLPPGDYVSAMIEQMRNQQGTNWSPQFEDAMRERYGLNEPITTQYAKWIGNIVLHGDFGYSFQNNEPSQKIIGDRMGMTILIAFASFMFTWMVALPIGIYSAVRQYSLGDYFFSIIGFIGMATPGFLIALVAMYVAFTRWGDSLSGLFSAQYRECALEPGQSGRSAQTPVDSDDHRRDGRDGRADPHYARQPARRTEQALRGNGARQGLAGVAAAAQIPGAPCAESLCQHHRLDAARAGGR